MADSRDRIAPLDELDDFEVAEGDPDVRGWEVQSSDGRRIGTVDDLLIDTTAMKVRYLDVDVDDELLNDDTNRHILIPIGYARLHEDEDQVVVDGLQSSQVLGIPEYTHEPLTPAYETSLARTYDPTYTTGSEMYEHDLYDDSRFYGPRRG